MLLAFIAAAWVAGLLLGASLLPDTGRGAPWALAVLVLCTLLGYAGQRARARSWALLLAVGAFAAGLVAAPRPSTHDVPRGLARMEVVVESVRHRSEDAVATVQLVEGSLLEGDAPLVAPMRLRIQPLDLPPRCRAQLLVRLRPATRFVNETPHPRWLDARPVDGEATLVAEPRVIDQGILGGTLHRARGQLRQTLNTTLPPHAAGVARALLLGDGAAVDRDDRDTIRGAGLAHLLAVSGLHVALLVGFVVFLSERLLRGRVLDARRAACLLGIPVALGFAVMAGGAPSAWRAALMATGGLGLYALRRRPDPVAIAGLACLVFAVVTPDDAVRPAFLLSVCATASIVSMHRPRVGFERSEDSKRSAFRLAWTLSWRTTVATAPLVVWCFGALPVGGVLANVVLLPLATLMLVPCAFLHACFAGIGLGGLTADVFTLGVDGLTAAAAFFAGLGEGRLPPPSILQGTLACVAALLLLGPTSRRRLVLLVLVVVGVGGAEMWLRHEQHPNQLRATFLDVGQGDGSIVDLPDGSAMLIDAGGGQPDPGARALWPLLQARRRSALRLVVVSHPHPDHYEGLRALLDEVPVEELWASGQGWHENPHGPAAHLLRAFRSRGTRVRFASDVCGTHEIGGARIEVLWPCPAFDPGYDPNDNSLVLRVSHGGLRILFTGDAEGFAEAELAEMNVRADVLKVGHHGSRTSSSAALLAAVQPRVAIASQGRSNRYGHPHPDVVARYAEFGIPLLCTSEVGGVELEGVEAGEGPVGLRWRTAVEVAVGKRGGKADVEEPRDDGS